MQSDSDNEKSCNHVPDYKIESDSEEEEYTQNNATIAKPDLQVIYDKASKTNTATLASKANNLSNKLDSKSTKLIMQQKQIRQLTITLEKERLKSRELMDQIHRTTPEATKQTSKETPLTSDISSKNEVKQLKQSLIQINRKLTDERIKTTSLNADLKTAEKLLKQETGLSLTELLKEKESNWKGRSETIILLREKIRDLSNCSNTLPTPESINTRAIRKIENGKKNEMLKIVSEFDELKIKYEDLKSKYNASVSRGIALDRNIKELKGHATFLVQKSDRDDLLIKTLEERVSFNVLFINIGSRYKNIQVF